MKNSLHRHAFSLLRFSVVAGILCLTARLDAQDNVWTGAASGNWQDASWSLGTLPATNQTIWVTNYGWKAVQIGADTANNFPQSLNVNAINISSPTNSFNTLLLNYAGGATPLTVQTITVASNSAVQLFSSALQINGPNGSGMVVGGLVEQNDSTVAGNQINVGYIGSGIYNFNSGYFTVSQLWLGGGATPGVFNQNGGTNGFGITHLDGGTYVLSNGWYGATIYFDAYGQFQQQGGLMANDLTLFSGSYLLAGGIHQGGATIPSQNGFTGGNANMLQTGGTNYGSLDIGSQGYGTYTMSNGVSYATNLSIGHAGSYFQAGGAQAVTGAISIDEQQVNFEAYEGGSFNLNDGQISASGLYSKGYYNQTGGTNVISGDITISGVADTTLTIFGGVVAADNLSVSPGFVGGVSVSGGTLIITNTLSVAGSSYFPEWHGFSGGGQLVVSNISLAPDAIFFLRQRRDQTIRNLDARERQFLLRHKLRATRRALPRERRQHQFHALSRFAHEHRQFRQQQQRDLVERTNVGHRRLERFAAGRWRAANCFWQRFQRADERTTRAHSISQSRRPHQRDLSGADSFPRRNCASGGRRTAGEHGVAGAAGRDAGDLAGRSRPHLRDRNLDRPDALGAVDQRGEFDRHDDRDRHGGDELSVAVLSHALDAVRQINSEARNSSFGFSRLLFLVFPRRIQHRLIVRLGHDAFGGI